MKIKKKRFALISTFNKNQLPKICKALKLHNIGIIATNSTAKYIKSHGFVCKKVSDVTRFKEVLDGRVKTLHPVIHASLLHKRDNKMHVREVIKNNYSIIDFVIVNLYPFDQAIKNSSFEKILEMIDIGGTALIRSACKNFESVTTISNPTYYNDFVNELNYNNGKTTLKFRKQMAINSFYTTSRYDYYIYKWLKNSKSKSIKPEIINLLYGENPDQKSQLKLTVNKQSILENVISKKPLSYNNILDVSSGIECVREFLEPTCVIIKHNNPCGVSSNANINIAYKNALNADPISAFGGIIIFNRSVNEKIAKDLYKKYIMIICAPDFTKKAELKLKTKKSLILIKTKKLKLNKYDQRSVIGGIISQSKNLKIINKKSIMAINNYRINDKLINDLIFALKVCKHVKSNAIVIANNKTTLGIGGGQMSRIDATKIALSKIKIKKKTKKFIVASDGFFPFNDSVKLLKKNGCNGLAAPSGSKNDNNLIKYVKKNQLNLFFTKERFFKH